METKFFVSSSPHVTDNESIPKIMYGVVLSLIPATIGAIYFFGIKAAWVIFIAIVFAVATEAIIQKMMKKPVTVKDGSAIVTAILLAFNLPAEVPWWIPAIGAIFAIAIGKIPFGGLGYNPMNPALLGRAFLLASWPTRITIFKTVPRDGIISGIDAISSATPLNIFKQAKDAIASQTNLPGDLSPNLAISQLYDSYSNLFLGKVGGCLGETSALLLLIGAIYLIYKRYISLRIPISYIATVAVLAWIFGGTEGFFTGDPIFHVLAGGLILGAFFMATDMVTSPVTPKGRILFGVGCGILTIVIRLVGGYPEGVSYSILLMNLTVPLIDRYTKPKVFGEVKKK